MEMKSPPPCPETVTVRRNPPRKARATPMSAIPLREPLSSKSLSRNIFSTEILQNPNTVDEKITDSSTTDLSETLKVFLRIRPLTVQKHIRSIAESKNAWPKNPRVKGNSRPKSKKSSEVCVHVNKDFRSVTVSTPQSLQEMKRIKSEVHEGFSHVFASEVSQIVVYEEMVKPLVEDFLKGKSGMLAAMGPSGSGKTHTVFGCAREPGMVPLALQRIFDDDESTATHKTRVFYLSMFEISSEGKAERMTDLLHDGSDVSMQQSVIKGLQEALVSDAQQADSLIANGMLKRSTAMTNSNSQSSRSQCIINIRCDSTQGGEVDGNASSSMLTIVDLAGAEREKKTGNQGARLLESNFINNTSMVFGQCLRSLLEHQKNGNKPPLQKHYKNSLLTRYLQDYLEGKKRMALILTVKPGEEDYLDTSFLLRQASPFTKIKFKTVDGPVNVTCNKRLNQALPQVMQPKKMKFSKTASLIEISPDSNVGKEVAGKVIKGCPCQNNEDTPDEEINEIHVLSDGFVGLKIQEKLSLKGDHDVKKDREYRIMLGFSKALWTVLKEYKGKLERAEMENHNLRDCIGNEQTVLKEYKGKLERAEMENRNLRDCIGNEQRRNLDLVNEMTREKMRLADLESRLCILQENSENLSYSSNELEKTYPSAKDLIVTTASRYAGPEYHHTQQIEELVQSSEVIQNTKAVKEFSTSTCSSSQDLGTGDMPSRSQETSQSTSGSHYTSQRPYNDLQLVEDMIVPVAAHSQTALSSPEFSRRDSTSYHVDEEQCNIVERKVEPPVIGLPEEGLVRLDAKNEVKLVPKVAPCSNFQHTKKPKRRLQPASSVVLKDINLLNIDDENDKLKQIEELVKSSEDTQNRKGVKELSTSTYSSSQDLICHEDMGTGDMSLRSQETIQLTSGSHYTSQRPDNDLSLVEDLIIPVAAHSQTSLSSSEFSRIDHKGCHVDKEQCNIAESKLEPPVIGLPEEGLDAKNEVKFVPKVAPCSNFQHTEKPKRRLQPASSVLLKDINLLNIDDENDKLKGGRGGKRGNMDDKNRTQGSLSLLNLLTRKLDR